MIRGPAHDASAAAILIHTCATADESAPLSSTAKPDPMLTRPPPSRQYLAGYCVPERSNREPQGYHDLCTNEPVDALRARSNGGSNEGQKNRADHKLLADLENIRHG